MKSLRGHFDQQEESIISAGLTYTKGNEMKKENYKIFSISFIFIYVLIFSLCVLDRQPLIFRKGYNLSQGITLFLLLGSLSFVLILVMETLEKKLTKIYEKRVLSPVAVYAYFVLLSIFGLFLFTLFAGFIESGLLFFYYGCVTNSCIYLLGGYTTTLLVSIYFAQRFIKKIKQ